MPAPDPYESAMMHQCQRGDPRRHGGYTGAICRKPVACRAEGRCSFVAAVERHFELHPEELLGDVMATRDWEFVASSVPPARWGKCCHVGWGEVCAPDCRAHRKIIRIEWHPGYDGFKWAL